MKEIELKALGPWLKYNKFVSKAKALAEVKNKPKAVEDGKYLSEEQCLQLLQTILKYKALVERTIIIKSQVERQSVFQRQFWSTWELQVDEMFSELFKTFSDVDSQALEFVGITQEHWQACLSHYFAYPKGFAQLCEINKQVIIAERSQNPCVKEDMDQKETAWRSLMLKDAELEDKMDAVLAKGDLELYHRVKVMEYAKIED